MSNKVDSRSAILKVGEYESADCQRCQVSISPEKDKHWVVSNVYVGRKNARRWDHLEHWHVPCYKDAGSPYGEAVKKPHRRVSGSGTDELEDESEMSGDDPGDSLSDLLSG
jgi:hypothetical protein